jgi:PTH1 family peptidyl-tRNA hydrolase
MTHSSIRLIVGLGNPETKYMATRHNAGFLALDVLAAELKAQASCYERMRCNAAVTELSNLQLLEQDGAPQGVEATGTPSKQGLFAKLTHGGAHDEKLLVLAKPQTYMNRSGQSVKGLLRDYGLHLTQLLVIHDDLDLPAGTLRIKQGGGHGGHNGLRSIIELCGADFARIKIGIGRPPGSMPSDRYVLQELRADALEELKCDAARATEPARIILTEGLVAAQNRFNAQ